MTVALTAECDCGHILDQHDELTDACTICLWCDYFKQARSAVSVNLLADPPNGGHMVTTTQHGRERTKEQ